MASKNSICSDWTWQLHLESFSGTLFRKHTSRHVSLTVFSGTCDFPSLSITKWMVPCNSCCTLAISTSLAGLDSYRNSAIAGKTKAGEWILVSHSFFMPKRALAWQNSSVNVFHYGKIKESCFNLAYMVRAVVVKTEHCEVWYCSRQLNSESPKQFNLIRSCQSNILDGFCDEILEGMKLNCLGCSIKTEKHNSFLALRQWIWNLSSTDFTHQ